MRQRFHKSITIALRSAATNVACYVPIYSGHAFVEQRTHTDREREVPVYVLAERVWLPCRVPNRIARLPFVGGCAEMANALGPTDCDAVHPGRINQIVFARRPVRTVCASVGIPSQHITYTLPTRSKPVIQSDTHSPFSALAILCHVHQIGAHHCVADVGPPTHQRTKCAQCSQQHHHHNGRHCQDAVPYRRHTASPTSESPSTAAAATQRILTQQQHHQSVRQQIAGHHRIFASPATKARRRGVRHQLHEQQSQFEQ